MILQSWGGVIRIFPAAPDAWENIVFHDMSTEGAFLVSAVMKKGKTQLARIKSLAGEPCRIIPGQEGVIEVTGNRNFNLIEVKPGLFTLDLKKGEEVILRSSDQMPELTIHPVMTGQE